MSWTTGDSVCCWLRNPKAEVYRHFAALVTCFGPILTSGTGASCTLPTMPLSHNVISNDLECGSLALNTRAHTVCHCSARTTAVLKVCGFLLQYVCPVGRLCSRRLPLWQQNTESAGVNCQILSTAHKPGVDAHVCLYIGGYGILHIETAIFPTFTDSRLLILPSDSVPPTSTPVTRETQSNPLVPLD